METEGAIMVDEISDTESESSSCSIGEFHRKPMSGRKAMMAAFGGVSKAENPSKAKKTTPSEVNKEDTSKFRNKQRVMLLCSRGTTQRYRHLMKDLESLLPHSKKDNKFDAKGQLGMLNELAELSSCNNTLYLETKKNQDLYLWMAKTPHGPTVKFHVQNVHTMDELKLTGNCLKGSRPILSFDQGFDSEPHLMLMKEMLTHTFGVPKGHRKSKPFFDHMLSFSICDGRIWFRNYQIVIDKSSENGMNLVEIGPRFVMNPVVILSGGFGGPVLYENPNFISPNVLRSIHAKKGADKYTSRVQSSADRQRKLESDKIPITEMTEVDQLFKQ